MAKRKAAATGRKTWTRIAARREAVASEAAEIDNGGVDTFARAMKAKLEKKRAEGYSGWETATPEHLARLLVEHVVKGDMIDVANFSMMLHQRMAMMGYHVANPEVRRAVLRDVSRAVEESRRRACLDEFFVKLAQLVERS